MPTNPPKPRKPAARKRPTKAEQERRAKQAAEAKGEPEIPLEHGVAVFRVDQGDGNYAFVLQTIGDVRVTEVGDVLRYGLKAHESSFGQ